MKKIILMLVIGLMMIGAVSAIDYYVDPAGDDTAGNGGLATPWKTIQKAIDSVATGDTINVAVGTYAENVIINNKQNLIIRKEKDTLYPNYLANRDSEIFKTYKKMDLIIRIKDGLLEYIKDNCMPDCIILFGSGSNGDKNASCCYQKGRNSSYGKRWRKWIFCEAP